MIVWCPQMCDPRTSALVYKTEGLLYVTQVGLSQLQLKCKTTYRESNYYILFHHCRTPLSGEAREQG